MFNQLDDYTRRPMRYQHIDGIWEMGIGFLFVMMVLLENSLRGAPPNTLWHWRGTFLLSIALLGFVVLVGVRVLKKRITYPRTGFVKYRGLAGKPWLASLIAGVVAIPVVIFLGYLRHHFKFSVPVALNSAAWGLMYAFMTRMDAAWRWVVLAVMVVGPVVISVLSVGREWLDAPWVGFLGLTYLVSGVLDLCLYLRRTRPLEQEAE